MIGVGDSHDAILDHRASRRVTDVDPAGDYTGADRYTVDSMRFKRPEDPWREQLLLATLGLAGEAGEVVEIVKKHIYHDHDLDKAKLVEELGDVLCYLVWIATLMGAKLSTVMVGNVAKLWRRFPEGRFSNERSKNRTC